MNRKQRRAAQKARGPSAARGGPSRAVETKLHAAFAQQKAGQWAAAKRLYEEVLARDPRQVQALNLLGALEAQQGASERARALIGKAIQLKPDFAEAHSNLGNLLKAEGKLEEAVAAYRRAIALKPGFAQAHFNLGLALVALGYLGEAIAAYQQVLRLAPDAPHAHFSLGNALQRQGRPAEAVAAYRATLKREPGHEGALVNTIFTMNYDSRFSQEEIFAESRRWAETHTAEGMAKGRRHGNDRDPDRRLRVGYVSADFREHPVSAFVLPLLAAHDREAVEVACYAEVETPDARTAEIRAAADLWRPTVGLTTADLARRIAADEVDVLVDLGGHTADSRLPVFAARPAPVQVTWLGYPNTTGLSVMDYRLTDAIADPEGEADRLHSEALVRLPNGFLCYRPPAETADPGPPPAGRTGQVTFGSFNNLAKVTPEVVATWAAVLAAVPGSRLLLKSLRLGDSLTQERYLSLFAEEGVDPGRIEMCPWVLGKSGHLASYEQVDIGLDPFPYNGTTTTCEALWMGVPVVTLLGTGHAGRVGASLLSRVGLEDLIAGSKEAYVEKAVGLAGDVERLAELRLGLRGRMAASPLCDAAGFARQVEAAYRQMWRRWAES